MTLGGRFLSIGECMVELSQAGNGLLRQGFAGDTFNTAWYARACLPSSWAVDYFTALGDDAASDEMEAFIADAGIGIDHIRRIPGKNPGLYMISLKDGERSFSYWRENAAAKQLAARPEHIRSAINIADVVYFSGITLAILPQKHIESLLSEMLRARTAGKFVVFDPNIRPRLWAEPDLMRETITAGAGASSLVMPSFDDELAHFGDLSIEATIQRYRTAGASNVLVKNGALGATLSFGTGVEKVEAVTVEKIVDTTSAGDSFNGAFLAHYLQHQTPNAAALFASHVAARVIGVHGALVDLDEEVCGVEVDWFE